MYDALERAHQCATVQLDFQLPIRFDLSYQGAGTEAKDALTESSTDAERGLAEHGKLRPVMIHRAVLGSVERMIAILTEHYAGKWPLWLSPRQLVIVPVTKFQLDYAEEVRQIFHAHHFHVDVDSTLNKLPKMILNAQKEQCARAASSRARARARALPRAADAHAGTSATRVCRYNYILVVGQTEVVARTVNVRLRSGAELGERSIEDFLAHITAERAAHGVGFEPASAPAGDDGAPSKPAPKAKEPSSKSKPAAAIASE